MKAGEAGKGGGGGKAAHQTEKEVAPEAAQEEQYAQREKGRRKG